MMGVFVSLNFNIPRYALSHVCVGGDIGITGGLAYPLLKIWMIDWQAKIRICWAIWMTFL